MMKTFET